MRATFQFNNSRATTSFNINRKHQLFYNVYSRLYSTFWVWIIKFIHEWTSYSQLQHGTRINSSWHHFSDVTDVCNVDERAHDQRFQTSRKQMTFTYSILQFWRETSLELHCSALRIIPLYKYLDSLLCRSLLTPRRIRPRRYTIICHHSEHTNYSSPTQNRISLKECFVLWMYHSFSMIVCR